VALSNVEFTNVTEVAAPSRVSEDPFTNPVPRIWMAVSVKVDPVFGDTALTLRGFVLPPGPVGRLLSEQATVSSNTIEEREDVQRMRAPIIDPSGSDK